MTTIRPLEARDEAIWRDLWQGYLTFYETSLPDDVTDGTWQRLIDADPLYTGWVAEKDGEVIGFVTAVEHGITWSLHPAGYLHDLFVRADVSGGGVGRALIDQVIAYGREQGWNRVYWMTKEDNATARRLYDTYAPADGFVRYRVAL